jgi:hypothetical protein
MADRDEERPFVGTTNLDLGLEAAGPVQNRTISTFSRGYQPAFAA